MTGESSAIHKYDVDFKKTPGTLSITSTHMVWVPKVKDAMDRQSQAMNRAINMLASKPGNERVSLKILFKENVPAGGLHFVFTNANTREDDRKAVQDVLIPFVAENKNLNASAPGTPGSATTPNTPSAATGAAMSDVAKGKRKMNEVTPAGLSAVSAESSPLPPAVRSQRRKYNTLRQRVLEKNDALRMLHRDLVLGRQITEEEFWEGREALIQAEEMAYAQKPGRPSRLLDDRFDLDAGRRGKTTGGTGVGIKQADNGPVILKLSKELTREIFEEFPVVQDAYAKYVPGINETEFWSRYFTSQLWERHRASVRKSANDEISRKKDDIFDQYLEEPDWNLQPRQPMPDRDGVERYLDLAATEEDHGEATSIRDVTMQAGRERSALPLIRRFNDHSKKLLRAASAGQTVRNSAFGGDIDIYEEINLEDLHDPSTTPAIILDVENAAVLHEGDDKLAPTGVLPGYSDSELLAMAAESASSLRDSVPDFSSVCLANPGPFIDNDETQRNPAYGAFAKQRDSQAAALATVKDMWSRANAENAVLPVFPEMLFEQIRSCHNSATEFLRQYWSAILPPVPGALGGQAPSAKDAKAAKMASYLKNTSNKIEAIVQTAQITGFDPERVRKALAPTLGAVEVALERERKRVKGR
ncbi:transcription initiation factor TFIIH subunit 1 [Cryptococcus neoformans Bt1]|nr:transcription initiation factor TFIIH subunit 1 [Cryptococcus neoformans var. grubii Bt1]OXG14215.1 transcription initiation factor TFIIH subunit 1 [Cryptococcus neoformans var. grubii Ze90-1]